MTYAPYPFNRDVAELNELISSMRQVQEELEAKIEEQQATIVFVTRERDELRLRVIELEARLDERRMMREDQK